jgi:hypothetical protein
MYFIIDSTDTAILRRKGEQGMTIFYRMQRNILLCAAPLLILYSIAHGQNISYQLPIDSSAVGKILLYNHNTTIQNDIEYINRRINDRVYFEMHVGGAYFYKMDENAILGVKFNVINPKLPFYTILKAKLFTVRRLAETQTGRLDPASSALLTEIENELAKYDTNKWRRLSLSVMVPIALMEYDTLYNRNFDGTSYHSSIRSTFNPRIIERFGISVGYDIGDLATVSIGSTVKSPRRMYGSVTFDISTPTYAFTVGFLNQLRDLLYPGMPGTPSLENCY